MSSFTPINAREVEEKKRAQARRCYWCVVMGSLEERCKHWDKPYEQDCRCDDEMHRDKKEDAAVKAETKTTVKAEHEAPAQPASERPIVEERASVASSSSTSSGKVNNRKTCSRCNGKEYNISNFKDHNKVHFLEDNGVPARFPCNCCKAGKCIVARCPKDLETYSCISCLRSHRQCNFSLLKAAKREKCKPGVHPALLRPIVKA
ncbi:hypothetical protein FACUT_1279 [Fusarium acutatum]|uniref:Uncharacterized protein n=1 Tax=Fusarium acutatum TaxID=78861 RepID=A0A8H4NZR4_9HYPO|nr:hypothetical protein FACUT_1279 [Fusarium acutatum]